MKRFQKVFGIKKSCIYVFKICSQKFHETWIESVYKTLISAFKNVLRLVINNVLKNVCEYVFTNVLRNLQRNVFKNLYETFYNSF